MGLEPIFGASSAEQTQAVDRGTHDVLPMIAHGDIVRAHPGVDLLHIDIAVCPRPLK